MNQVQLPDIEKVQRLTQEYASYSQSRNGLGNALGGAIGIIIYLVNGLSGGGLLVASLTIGLTIFWLIGKEVIRRRLYRPFGTAKEIWSPKMRRYHQWSVAFVALVALGVWIFYAWNGWLLHSSTWPYLLFVAVMPWIAWYYLRAPEEFVVGIFLLCACAVTSVGGTYGLLEAFWVPIAAICLLFKGLYEHRKFRTLTANLQMQHVEGV